MKKEIFDALPYSAIKELIDLREYFKKATNSLLSVITERQTNDESVLYEFIENLNGYAFVISNLYYDEIQKKNFYTIYRRPSNDDNMKGDSIIVDYSKISILFSRWVDSIESMNQIQNEYLNPNNKFYEKEFEEFFTNDDEDASINPFEIERQEVLYCFLTYTEKQIDKSEDIDDSTRKKLLEQVSQLKDDIPKLTKKKFVFALSKIAKQIKISSNKLFHDVFDVLKKELIKKILYEGAAQIPNAVAKIEHWIHLLNS